MWFLTLSRKGYLQVGADISVTVSPMWRARMHGLKVTRSMTQIRVVVGLGAAPDVYARLRKLHTARWNASGLVGYSAVLSRFFIGCGRGLQSCDEHA